MRYDDLDRTSVLVRKEKNTSDGRKLDDTQELPPLSQDASPIFSRQGTVRELPPLTSKMENQRVDAAESGNRRQSRFRKGLIFAA